jgi:CHASE3 domain sensor protein
VDRIVNVDAPATTISEQVSVEMLEARRAERNYLLLRDPAYVEANRASIAKARETLIEIQNLAPSEQQEAQKALDELPTSNIRVRMKAYARRKCPCAKLCAST